MKKFFLVIGLCLVLIVLGGCSKVSEKERMELAEKAMEEKYGESFETQEIQPAQGDSFFAWIRPKSHSNIVVKAIVSGDGSQVDDDYATKTVCHAISNDVEWKLREWPGDFFVHTENILEIVSETDLGLTPKEYLERHPGDRFDIAVIVTGDEGDMGTLYHMALKIRENIGFSDGSIRIYRVEKEQLELVQAAIENYDELNSEEADRILNDSSSVLISMSPEKMIPTEEEFLGGVRL